MIYSTPAPLATAGASSATIQINLTNPARSYTKQCSAYISSCKCQRSSTGAKSFLVRYQKERGRERVPTSRFWPGMGKLSRIILIPMMQRMRSEFFSSSNLLLLGVSVPVFESVLVYVLLCVWKHIWGSVVEWLIWFVILRIGRIEIGRLGSWIQRTTPLALVRSYAAGYYTHCYS